MSQMAIRYRSQNIWGAATCSAPGKTILVLTGKLQTLISRILDLVLPKNPVTKRREFRFIPLWVENALGATSIENACPHSKICQDKALVANVEAVFERMIKVCDRQELKYEIRVKQDDDTVNAFCAPGGKMIITTGILKALQKPLAVDAELGVTFDDKLAAILGHEITHAAAGHGAKSMQIGLIFALVGRIGSFVIPRLLLQRKNEESELKYELKVRALEVALDIGWRVGSFFFSRKHSRGCEFEADKYAIKYAAKAGFKPEGSVWLQHLFIDRQSKKTDPSYVKYFQTHPTSQKRLKKNIKTVAKIKQEGV